MSTPSKGRYWLLLALGLVGLALVMIGLANGIAGVESDALAHWRVDPETGLVMHLYTGKELFGSFYPGRFHMLELAVLAVGAIALALYWLDGRVYGQGDSQRRIGLAWTVAPLAAPLLLTLATVGLTDRAQQRTLEAVVELGSSAELEHVPMSCFGSLMPCSRLLAFDTVWGFAAVAIVAVTIVMLVPAARVAWRAARHGRRLGAGWCLAAVACFGLGVLALVSTRPHRADRATALSSCGEGQHWWEYRSDRGLDEVRGLETERCSMDLHWADTQAFDYSIEYDRFVVSETGALAEYAERGRTPKWQTGDQLRAAYGEHEYDRHEEFAEVYIDERVSPRALSEALLLVSDVGYGGAVLTGTSMVSGRFETLGLWSHRVECQLAVVRFDPEGWPVEGFESLAELVSTASPEGAAGLLLAVGLPARTDEQGAVLDRAFTRLATDERLEHAAETGASFELLVNVYLDMILDHEAPDSALAEALRWGTPSGDALRATLARRLRWEFTTFAPLRREREPELLDAAWGWTWRVRMPSACAPAPAPSDRDVRSIFAGWYPGPSSCPAHTGSMR